MTVQCALNWLSLTLGNNLLQEHAVIVALVLMPLCSCVDRGHIGIYTTHAL